MTKSAANPDALADALRDAILCRLVQFYPSLEDLCADGITARAHPGDPYAGFFTWMMSLRCHPVHAGLHPGRGHVYAGQPELRALVRTRRSPASRARRRDAHRRRRRDVRSRLRDVSIQHQR